MKIKFLSVVTLAAMAVVCAAEVSGQITSDRTRRQVARGNNIYCAGYITWSSIETDRKIIGGEEEQEQRVYSEGDYVYINGGAQQGVKVDDRFNVTRPRGRMHSKFSRKGDLGIYVEEVGALRVVEVKQNVAVAVIEAACRTILLGDLLIPLQIERIAPNQRQEVALDRFKDPSGKASGRLVLARDGQEMISRDQIVYVDLGGEDGVKIGDYLTVYRPVGTGNVTTFADDEVVRPKDYGFESLRYRGGKFSNQAPRKKGSNARGRIETTPEIKDERPELPRKVVGEMVIISVHQKTATAVITRTAQEIHTGDYVELQ